jgi:hypothetical protein
LPADRQQLDRKRPDEEAVGGNDVRPPGHVEENVDSDFLV